MLPEPGWPSDAGEEKAELLGGGAPAGAGGGCGIIAARCIVDMGAHCTADDSLPSGTGFFFAFGMLTLLVDGTMTLFELADRFRYRG
jgi:hypothetical protein